MERDTRMWRGWIKSRELVLPEILSELGEDIPGWIPSREREFSKLSCSYQPRRGWRLLFPVEDINRRGQEKERVGERVTTLNGLGRDKQGQIGKEGRVTVEKCVLLCTGTGI